MCFTGHCSHQPPDRGVLCRRAVVDQVRHQWSVHRWREALSVAGRLAVVVATTACSVALTNPVSAGDGPSGFYWGTDSNGPVPNSSASPCASSSAPWLEPNVSRSGCGHFGGYVGEIGGYWDVNNCIGSDAFSTSAANRANTNLYSYGYGIGAQSYFFAAGPGMDPNYDGTTSEAHDWGVKQAKIAVAEAADYSMVREILVIDVEDGTAAPYTGE